jgi:ABC-2 type transport system permease protein
MRVLWAVFRKEFRSYFVSPIAYVVMGIFLVISGYFFYSLVRQFGEASLFYFQQAAMMRQSPPPMTLNEWVIRPFFLNTSVVVLFLMPLMTMRLLAEEKKTGSIELLLTSPVTDVQVAAGKLLAAFALFASLIATTLVYMLILQIFGKPDWGPILSGYVGLLLMGASFLALGLLVSSLTENQIVAGTISFGLFLMLWVIQWASSFTGPVFGKVLEYLSVVSHFEEFGKGVLDTRDVVFYLSVIGVGFFLTLQSLMSFRWRG